MRNHVLAFTQTVAPGDFSYAGQECDRPCRFVHHAKRRFQLARLGRQHRFVRLLTRALTQYFLTLLIDPTQPDIDDQKREQEDAREADEKGVIAGNVSHGAEA